MPVDFVIDHEHQTPVKSSCSSARLPAKCASGCMDDAGWVTLVAFVVSLALHPLAY